MGMLLSSKEYIYFVDDDNIVHPALLEFLETAPLDGTAYVFHQGFKDGRLRIKGQPDRMGIGGIDTAMFLIPKELATDIWWEMHNYCADGVFIGTIYNKFPERFTFIDKIMAYYNYLS